MGSVIACLNDVKKSFGPTVALSSVSLALKKGEIFGYIGPNGAGKTTTIRILLGLLRADSGLVELFGTNPYVDEPQSLIARSRVGAMLETPGHFIYATAERNLAYHARLRGVKNMDKRIANILKLVGLYEKRDLRVETFSHGMSQRLAFARAIIHDPDFLILDEPTSGLDPSGQKEVRQVLKQLVVEGKTVFLSSHNLPEVEEICTRIAIIVKGRIVFCGEMASLREQYGCLAFRVKLSAEFGFSKKEELIKQIAALPYVIGCVDSSGELRVELLSQSDAAKLNQYLVSRGVPVEELSVLSPSLGEIYETLVQKEGKDDDYKYS